MPTHGEYLLQLQSGSIYVMNENGSTVAKYDLGGYPEVAQGTTTG